MLVNVNWECITVWLMHHLPQSSEDSIWDQARFNVFTPGLPHRMLDN